MDRIGPVVRTDCKHKGPASLELRLCLQSNRSSQGDRILEDRKLGTGTLQNYLIIIFSINNMITSVPYKSPTQPAPSQYHQIYNKLQSFVDVLDTKLMNKIQSIQHNFADQYKQAVRVMNDQLQEIRVRLDSAALKQKSNGKIKILEEERNLFREMSRQLDAKLKEERNENKELKKQVKVLEDELENYKRICFKLEMEMSKSRKEMVEVYRMKNQGISTQSTKRSTINKESLREVIRSLEKQKQKQKEHLEEFRTNEPTIKLPKSSHKSFSNSNRQTVSHTMLPTKKNHSYTVYKPKSPSPSSQINPHLIQFEQIFTNCLNSIKKELLYRTTSPISNNYQYFVEEGSSIPFQKLTLTDKKQLVKLFIEDAKVLDNLYEFVFAKILHPNNDEKMRSTTVRLFDNKFNEKNLEMMKRKFQERVATTRQGTFREK